MRARPEVLSIVVAALAGCARDGGTSDPASRSSGAAAAETTLAVAPEAPASGTAAPGSAVPREHRMPRAYRGRLKAAVALNATCVSCHEPEAAAWQGSRHHAANTNAAYREAFAVEPSPFCRGCHAPEADPRKDPPRDVGDLGVGCVTCHVTEEESLSGGDGGSPPIVTSVLAAPRDGAGEAVPAGHPAVHRSADFARTGGCAGCHEFAFPGLPGEDDGQLMQTTVREHARSAAAGKPCAACHMPVVDGRRSHAFAQVRDAAWLRSNLRVTAQRTGERAVRLTLAQPAPGHGFPTGDLFRRLEVGCEVRGADGKALARDVRYLARHFQMLPGRPGRHLVRDDRVLDTEAVVELSPARGSGTIAWWVKYQRVATTGAGTNPAEAKIESEVDLHSGLLP